jgi:hypothetical protein
MRLIGFFSKNPISEKYAFSPSADGKKPSPAGEGGPLAVDEV